MNRDEPRQPGDLQRFASSVGHDINNLITGILGSLSLVRQEISETDPACARVDHAILCAKRATFLGRQLLSLSGTGRAPLNHKALDVNEVLLRSRALLELVLPAEAVLSYELAPDLPLAQADMWDLQGVCLALTANAGEALREGAGVITLRSGQEEAAGEGVGEEGSESHPSTVWVEVCDDGRGIAPADLARVREPLFTTKAGRGLGLSYAESVSTSFGGELEIRSSPAGTTVRVRIPAK